MFSDRELFDSIGRTLSSVVKAIVVLLVLGVVAVLLVGAALWWAWSHFA